MKKLKINTIFFDVFGTVFDWHKSIREESKNFSSKYKLSFDEFVFTDKWRAGFRLLQSKVANGQRDYLSMDEIHMEVLNQLLDELNINDISKENLVNFNESWHRLKPWDD